MMKLGIQPNKKKELQKEEVQKDKELKRVKWAKTDHDFLTRDQLRQYRRMLGDVLIVQGLITAEQFKYALSNVDKEHGQQVGAYLIEEGLITEEQMIRALGHVKHIQFIPDELVEKLDYNLEASRFDIDELRGYKILPLTNENGITIIGVCNSTKEEDIKEFELKHGIHVKKMYMMEEYMINAYGLLEKNREILKSLELYHKGDICYEQVILVGKYAAMKGTSEKNMRHIMGILK